MIAAAAVTLGVVCLLALSAGPAAAYETPVSSTDGPINVPQSGTPTQYPDQINVSSAPGTEITNLTVTLSGITSNDIQDLSAELVGPGGSLALFAGVGSGSASNLDITLDDSISTPYSTAGATLPSTGFVMAPTDLADSVSGAGVFPAPAPPTTAASEAAPTGTGTLNNVFDGTDPNGTWSLYLDDDASDGGATLSGWSLNITSANSQAISFTSSAPSPAYGDGTTYTPTATGGNSGNPVVFNIDAASTPGACTISSGVVSFTAAGSCLIDASQTGNTDYTAAPQGQQSVAVGQAAQAINFSSSAPSDGSVGGPTYTPTATGGNSGNQVVFTIDPSSTSICSISSGVVSFTAAGNCQIDANQTGDANYLAAAETHQIVVVGPAAQTIRITTTGPSTPTFPGTTYAPTATGGKSGNPVIFTIDSTSTPGACTINTGTVSFTGAGTCLIDANQLGNANYLAAAQEQQSIAIQILRSRTTLVVSATTLKVSVTGTGPTPAGSVTLFVNGSRVGTVHLRAGEATLRHLLARGRTYTVVARYLGDNAYAKSSATRTYTQPSAPAPTRLPPLKVAVKLSSSRPETAGWWTAPVTVRFICTRAGRPVTPCRRPVKLARSGRGQIVAGQTINIDLGRPTVALSGVNPGAIYLVSAPKPSCHARDTVSGITSCSISKTVQDLAAGERAVTFTARAVNKAGTAATRSISVTEQQPGLIGRVSSATGIYVISQGRTYTVEVASKTKPLYLEGTVAPKLPSGAHNFFSQIGHHRGTPLWELSVVLPSGLPKHSYWNIGVQIGGRIEIISIPAGA